MSKFQISPVQCNFKGQGKLRYWSKSLPKRKCEIARLNAPFTWKKFKLLLTRETLDTQVDLGRLELRQDFRLPKSWWPDIRDLQYKTLAPRTFPKHNILKRNIPEHNIPETT